MIESTSQYFVMLYVIENIKKIIINMHDNYDVILNLMMLYGFSRIIMNDDYGMRLQTSNNMRMVMMILWVGIPGCDDFCRLGFSDWNFSSVS